MSPEILSGYAEIILNFNTSKVKVGFSLFTSLQREGVEVYLYSILVLEGGRPSHSQADFPLE